MRTTLSMLVGLLFAVVTSARAQIEQIEQPVAGPIERVTVQIPRPVSTRIGRGKLTAPPAEHFTGTATIVKDDGDGTWGITIAGTRNGQPLFYEGEVDPGGPSFNPPLPVEPYDVYRIIAILRAEPIAQALAQPETTMLVLDLKFDTPWENVANAATGAAALPVMSTVDSVVRISQLGVPEFNFKGQPLTPAGLIEVLRDEFGLTDEEIQAVFNGADGGVAEVTVTVTATVTVTVGVAPLQVTVTASVTVTGPAGDWAQLNQQAAMIAQALADEMAQKARDMMERIKEWFKDWLRSHWWWPGR